MNNVLIARWRYNNSNIVCILRCRTNHRRATDVDLFDRFFQRDTLAHDGLHKWIEIHNEDVDWLDSVLLHGGDVLRIVANPKQSAVYTWMECLHAPVHHFWKACDVR